MEHVRQRGGVLHNADILITQEFKHRSGARHQSMDRGLKLMSLSVNEICFFGGGTIY